MPKLARKSASPTPTPSKPRARPDVSAKAGKAKVAPKPLTPGQAWSKDPEAALSELCTFIVGGGHLAAFCKEKGFAYTSALTWIQADSRRTEMYARAREDRSDILADEIVAISDETEVKVRYEGEEAKLAMDAAAVQRNRLRVDARKWVASKLKPRVYGEKVQVDANVSVTESSDEELAKRLARFGIQVVNSAAKPEGEDVGS